MGLSLMVNIPEFYFFVNHKVIKSFTVHLSRNENIGIHKVKYGAWP